MPWTGEIKLYVYRNASREDWPMEQWRIQVGPSREQTAQMMKVSREKATLQPASLFLLQWYHLLLLLPTDIRLILQLLNTDSTAATFQGASQLQGWTETAQASLGTWFSASSVRTRLLVDYPASIQSNKSLYNIYTYMHTCVSTYTFTHACIYMYVYIHTHTCMHIYVGLHTHAIGSVPL